MPIASINPATQEMLREFSPLTSVEIEQKLALAATAFAEYHRTTTFAQRAQWLTRAAEILENEKEQFGRIMTLEMGKTLGSARDEAAKCALGCRYYAEHGEALLQPEDMPTAAARSYIRYDPLGPVLAIMPWNFPFWQVFRFAAPALMAGNVGLLKHAGNVPQCALAIEEIFTRAGFPAGVFQTLLITAEQTASVIEDERVKAVTLTGSTGAGSSVAATAGKQIKKTVLELGGSDPFIVMPSADFDKAVQTAVQARTINNGQSCIAAKRFLMAESIADRFEREFVSRMRALPVGDPFDPATAIGPLATPAILDGLHEQVQRAVQHGAKLITGGQRLPGAGNFYAPTVLTNVEPDSPVYREELFGPVAMVFRVPDVAAAIRIANDSPFGLGASVWTRDEGEQREFISGVEAGMVFVNAMVASDPRLPFGGVKQSGYGRELGPLGIREFVNCKSVWIAPAEHMDRTTTE